MQLDFRGFGIRLQLGFSNSFENKIFGMLFIKSKMHLYRNLTKNIEKIV